MATDGKVFFSITVDAAPAPQWEAACAPPNRRPRRARRQSAMVALPLPSGAGAERAEPRGARGAPRLPQAPPRAAQRGPQGPVRRHRTGAIPGVANIIAVASGKGGVGKSTTAVNFALALNELGLKVGVLDADIYGPSMPRLLGSRASRRQLAGNKLAPMEAYGLKVMSMGFLVDEETPMIWRGPMVMSALSQMLKDVAWGELDVLVVDMPPGTGDAQLTMAQQVPLAGAVIVSTPQDLALIDARKGIDMFRKVNVPVLGIVENMSTFICPHCGERSDIFGHGGARARGGATRRAVPRRGAADARDPRDLRRRPPVVASDPDGPPRKPIARSRRACVTVSRSQAVRRRRSSSRRSPRHFRILAAVAAPGMRIGNRLAVPGLSASCTAPAPVRANRCRWPFRCRHFADLNRAARACHRDERFAGAAQQFALGVARRFVERAQTGGAGRSVRTRGTLRPDGSDATAGADRTGWTGYAGGARAVPFRLAVRLIRSVPADPQAGPAEQAAPGGPAAPCGPCAPSKHAESEKAATNAMTAANARTQSPLLPSDGFSKPPTRRACASTARFTRLQ